MTIFDILVKYNKIISIHDTILLYLDPFCEDATTLNSDAAMSAMTRLHNSITELKNLKAKIAELEAYLD